MTFILLAIAILGMHRLRALDRQVEHRATWHICPICQRDVHERVVAMHAKTHDAPPTWCSARFTERDISDHVALCDKHPVGR